MSPPPPGGRPYALRRMRLNKLSATAIVLIVICAAGFGLRAVKVFEPNPVPGDDARAYYALASSLYEDGTFGGPDFNNASDWSPGAPLLYAGMFYVTGGPREGTIRALQALLGLAAILVAFALARRLARGSGRMDLAGLLAAGGVAFYPPFIHSTGAAMSEPLAVLLLPATLLATLWAADRSAGRGAAEGSGAAPAGGHGDGTAGGRAGGSTATDDDGATPRSGRGQLEWLVPGLLAGLLALARPEYLVVGVALAVIVAWVAGEHRVRRGFASGTLFLLALAVPVIPWTVHNLNTLERLVPISTGSGKALYVGTYMPGDGDYQRTKAILAEQQLGVEHEPGSPELDAVEPRPLFDTIAEAENPDLPRDTALGRVGREQLSENLSERPGEYAAMLGRKVWRMWSTGQGAVARSVPGRVVQVLLVLAGLAGLVVLARRRRWLELVLCGLPVAAVSAIGAVTLASDRRAQILMAVMLPLAAVALAALAERRDGARRILSGP